MKLILGILISWARALLRIRGLIYPTYLDAPLFKLDYTELFKKNKDLLPLIFNNCEYLENEFHKNGLDFLRIFLGSLSPRVIESHLSSLITYVEKKDSPLPQVRVKQELEMTDNEIIDRIYNHFFIKTQEENAEVDYILLSPEERDSSVNNFFKNLKRLNPIIDGIFLKIPEIREYILPKLKEKQKEYQDFLDYNKAMVKILHERITQYEKYKES